MRYATVVFDLDGTLVDTRPGIEAGIRHALCAMDMSPPEDAQVKALIGPPLAVGFRTVFGLSEAKAQQCVTKYREYYAQRGVLEAKPYPGIEIMLRGLRDENVELRVATLKPAVFARRVLEHLGLLSFFSQVHGPDLDEHSDIKKRLVADALEGAPMPAAMVGDREGDILGAHAAGVDSVAATYGFGSREELTRCRPTYLAHEAWEILGILS